MPRTDEDLNRVHDSSEAVVGRLADIGYSPSGDTSHAWHMDWIDRGKLLAMQLTSILQLESARHYPSAFALARVALEHLILDRLIILAARSETLERSCGAGREASSGSRCRLAARVA